MKKTFAFLTVILGLAFCVTTPQVQANPAEETTSEVKYEANWNSLNSRPTPQWFSDSKFGIFIHWGIYAVPGWATKGNYSEWYWCRIADQMEVSLYNALLAAQMPAGNWWSYFTGLMGVRTASHEQFADIHGSCCVANGPRALMLTPYWATMQSADGLAVNQYSPAQITAKTPTGKALGIAIAGDYPRNGTVKISLKPEQAEAFTLKLRVPGWSKATAIKINGEPYTDYIISGTYANIVREWKAGDVVQLNLDMRVRAISAPSGVGDLALMRGPIVLAVDTRLQPLNYAPNPMPRCEFALATDATVDAKLIESADSNIWLTFQVPLKDEGGKDQTIQMCDFASAGNLWNSQNGMRTWIPQPFDARHLYIELNDQATTWPGTVPNVPECYRR